MTFRDDVIVIARVEIRHCSYFKGQPTRSNLFIGLRSLRRHRHCEGRDGKIEFVQIATLPEAIFLRVKIAS
ncbi:hypothetical protein ACFPIK_05230 [Algoriphagus aquatilis]|uniref:Uncharacterized protein n=1 Tax=Algoriphagus aquatilis TaxID=490186 RepID=A0ABW0BU58_9BACT